MAASGRDVLWVYQRLLKKFGPQGWWPVTPPGGDRPLYSPRWTKSRQTLPQAFEVLVGAVLTQNTAWTNVEQALASLIKHKLLFPSKMAKISQGELEGYVRPAGYFRQKARRLREISAHFQKHWQGQLAPFLNRKTAVVRGELLALKGVGPETADSILLYAGNHPVFVVDAYTRRIGQRFGLFPTSDYQRVQFFFEKSLKPDRVLYREYHALLVALAKDHCRTKPLCKGCPLSPRCGVGRQKV